MIINLKTKIRNIIYNNVDDGGVGTEEATDLILKIFIEFVSKRKKKVWNRNSNVDKAQRDNELYNLIVSLRKEVTK